MMVVAIAAGLWASPVYRGGDRPGGAAGVVLDVAAWGCLLGGIGALLAAARWTFLGRWGRVATALLLVIGALGALLVSFSSTGR